MKNIDLDSLTKAELIKGIIRLTEHTNMLLRSRGCRSVHKCYSESTLRTKQREEIELLFTHAWDWLREEIRANYKELAVDVDKAAIDALKEKTSKELDDNYDGYLNLVNNGKDEITNIIVGFMEGTGMSNMFDDIHMDDVIITVDSDECICIKLKNGFGSEIRYYHRHSWAKLSNGLTEPRDEINFGTVGAFDLDSQLGHQQMFQMSLLSRIGSSSVIRAKLDVILDRIHDDNINRIRTTSKIESALVAGIDEIVAPYINSIATGKTK